MKKEDFLCKNDTEVLLELVEVPQLKDKVERILEEFIARRVCCFSPWSYFYIADKRIRGLAFPKYNLKAIPEPIFKLDALEELYLEKNRITVIPDAISRLKNLTKLFLSSNRIRKVSDSINSLDSLEYLDLKRNQLKNLPEDISNLRKLDSLYLNKNDLRQLPQSVTTLDKLKYLDISYNPNLIISHQVSKFLNRERDGSRGFPSGQKIMQVKGLEETLVAPYIRKLETLKLEEDKILGELKDD